MIVNEKKPTYLLQRMFELRRAKRIPLDALTKAMRVTSSEGASKIENGQTPLRAESIPEIAKILGVKIWELFQDYDKPLGNEPLDDQARTMVDLFRDMRPEDKVTVMNLMTSLVGAGTTPHEKDARGARGTHAERLHASNKRGVHRKSA